MILKDVSSWLYSLDSTQHFMLIHACNVPWVQVLRLFTHGRFSSPSSQSASRSVVHDVFESLSCFFLASHFRFAALAALVQYNHVNRRLPSAVSSSCVVRMPSLSWQGKWMDRLRGCVRGCKPTVCAGRRCELHAQPTVRSRIGCHILSPMRLPGRETPSRLKPGRLACCCPRRAYLVFGVDNGTQPNLLCLWQ